MTNIGLISARFQNDSTRDWFGWWELLMRGESYLHVDSYVYKEGRLIGQF